MFPVQKPANPRKLSGRWRIYFQARDWLSLLSWGECRRWYGEEYASVKNRRQRSRALSQLISKNSSGNDANPEQPQHESRQGQPFASVLTNFDGEHLTRFGTVRRQHLHKQAILAPYREVIPPLGFSCSKRQAHLGENAAFCQRKVCREENRPGRLEPQV